MIKAGILFPRSGIFPYLGSDFLKGIKTFLSVNGLSEQIELIPEPIGFGADKKEVYQQTEQLLLIREVDVLVAYIDLLVTDLVFPLILASGKPCIIVNPGANYSVSSLPPDNVLFLGLQDALFCRMIGKKAAESKPVNASFAISYFDGGYHHGHAMVNAFMQGGGEIQFNYVSPLRTADFNINALAQFLDEHPEAQCVLSIFSGEESNRFLEALNKVKNAERLSIYCSPQVLEEQTVEKLQISPVYPVQGFVPWHSGINNAENVLFCSAIEKETGRKANGFFLLGWEAAQIIGVLTSDAAGKLTGPAIRKLEALPVKTPRGTLVPDSNSHYLIGPAFEAELKKNTAVRITGEISAEDCLQEWTILQEKNRIEEASGWLNTYLCC